MGTDVVEAAAEISGHRPEVWDLLISPGTYTRLFTGVASCECLADDGESKLLRFGLQSARTGPRSVSAHITIGRHGRSFELHSPSSGLLANVRLHTVCDRTRVVVIVLVSRHSRPDRAALSPVAVTRWTEAGLSRLSALAAPGTPGPRPIRIPPAPA
ncbi:hypothetical protein AB0L57_22560 [Nocardia sp. NPDC052254]|uniref:hypothetical protein n=1 Tax=Nocardia sp. NPDC052254 TaxID=3155681 RepID=UPI00343E66BD